MISLLQGIFDDSMDPSSGEEHSLVVLADFLSAVELKGNGLNLDACVQLLPMFESMINECMHLENVMKAAITSTSMLCEAFGDLITQTRAVNIMGVDLSREERLKKCNRCYESLYRIRKRLEVVKRRHGEKGPGILSPVTTSSNRLIDILAKFGINMNS